MHRVAMIGDKDSILAFKAFDFDIFVAANAGEARENWLKLNKKDYGMVFITEPYYEEMASLLNKNDEELLPTVLCLPPTTGSTGFAMNRIKTIVQKAIGTDLLTEKEENHGTG